MFAALKYWHVLYRNVQSRRRRRRRVQQCHSANIKHTWLPSTTGGTRSSPTPDGRGADRKTVRGSGNEKTNNGIRESE